MIKMISLIPLKHIKVMDRKYFIMSKIHFHHQILYFIRSLIRQNSSVFSEIEYLDIYFEFIK